MHTHKQELSLQSANLPKFTQLVNEEIPMVPTTIQVSTQFLCVSSSLE